MNMTIDELVQAQIRNYLSSEDFIDKYDIEKLIKEAVEEIDTDEIAEQVKSLIDYEGTYATTEYVDDETRSITRDLIDEIDLGQRTSDLENDLQETRKELQELIGGAQPYTSVVIEQLKARISALEPKQPQSQNPMTQYIEINSLFAGYSNWETLEAYIRSSLINESEAPMIINMVLATARNMIDQKLEGVGDAHAA